MKASLFTLFTAAILVSAFNSASMAQKTDEAEQQAAPIPTLRCEIKTMSACSPDGKCKADNDIDGIKLPLRMTIDFENGMVAAVDDTGFARTDKMDQLAKTQDQLVLHGIDGEFGWQILISDKTEVASLVMSTADSVLAGFGSCINK